MKQHDVVCTNPPFSKINHFMSFVFKNGKDIIVIMNMMALMYNGIKDYAMKGIINCANRCSGAASFKYLNGNVCRVHAIVVTTLNTMPFKIQLHGYTT